MKNRKWVRTKSVMDVKRSGKPRRLGGDRTLEIVGRALWRRRIKKVLGSKVSVALMIYGLWMSQWTCNASDTRTGTPFAMGRTVSIRTSSGHVVRGALQERDGKWIVLNKGSSEQVYFRDQEVEAIYPLIEKKERRPNNDAKEHISIATWNVSGLADGCRSDVELGIMAMIIWRYDFIVLQDVGDKEVVERLKGIMEKEFWVNYAYIVSDTRSSSPKRSVFFWRTENIEQTQPEEFYARDESGGNIEPYVAGFRAGDVDFTVAAVRGGVGVGQTERSAEIAQLADVYELLKVDQAKREIILCVDVEWSNTNKDLGRLRTNDAWTWDSSVPLSMAIGEKARYSNIWWSASSEEVDAESVSVFEFDEVIYPAGAVAEAIRMISAHRPVNVDVRIRAVDD